MSARDPWCDAPAPWLVLLAKWQADTNALASVAIEMPQLRPVLARRVAAFDGDENSQEPSS